ncbi:MAG: PAS domain S-box protein [Candidatus Methanoperedens sp.]
MSGKNDKKPKHIHEIGKLIWVSFAFATVTWFFDSILDSLIFHEGTLSEQIFTPTSHEFWTRLLFAFILVIFGAYSQLNATKRMHAEDKLREGERFLASIFASIQDGIGILDKDMNILRVNPTAERWYPHSAPFVGRKCYEAYHGRNKPCEVCPALKTLETGESAYEVVPKHGHDGKEVGWLEIYSFPLMDTTTGQMRGVIEYVRDITGRKRAEEALKLFSEAVENAPDGVQITDIEGHIIYSNKSVEEIYGFSPEELKGKHVNKMNSDPEFASKVIIPGIKETGRWSGELMVRHKNGKIFPIMLTTSIVKNGNDKPIAMVGIIHDITKRKQAEEEIRKYAGKLEESNRIKELFTDIMHHDLLNPLNISKGFVELLREDESVPVKIANMEIIERNLTKCMELIESATMLSKLESLEHIEFEDMDLKDVIGKVTENLSSMADRSGMKIENNINQSMPARANKIIEDVFANIISNAIKYASEGKRIILDSENEGRVWKIRVADFGEGIPDVFKTAIFERFQWMEKKGVKGSGLGLAIARKIMEFHKGRIWVEDNPEGGAIFIVEIPKS